MSQPFWWVYVIAAALFGWVVLTWSKACRVYGSIDAKLIRDMLWFALMGAKRYRVYAGAFFLLVAACNAVSPGSILPFPYVIWVAAGLHTLSSVCLPPAVLLLSSSWADTPRLVKAVGEAVFPLRAVHLLDTYLDQQVPDRYRHETLSAGSLRTYNPQKWRVVIDRLTEVVPVVVLDTRIDTPALLEEAGKLLAAGRARKTVFVVNEDGSSPTLERLRPPPAGPFVAVREEEVGRLLRSLTRR